jgi:Glutaredoxin-like domain (DUF836)
VTHLTIYWRPGCHLCDEMKNVCSTVVTGMPAGTIAVEYIDISTDPTLDGLYGEEIPVLLIDGRKTAKYRITANELKRRLERSDRSGRSEQ